MVRSDRESRFSSHILTRNIFNNDFIVQQVYACHFSLNSRGEADSQNLTGTLKDTECIGTCRLQLAASLYCIIRSHDYCS